MRYLKFFENFNNKLTIEYLGEEFPIYLDDYYLSNFGIERFYVMIDDKPSYYTSDTGFNQTKNALHLLLKEKGFISDDRVDVPIIKQYLRSVLNKKILIWIHGLPGSGKSSVAIEKQRQLPDKNFIILDDIGNMEDVENLLREGENIILTSPYFENYSFTKNFDNLKEKMKFYTNYSVLHLWFENDVEACINNLKSRTGHKIDSKYIIPEMEDFSKKYKIPQGAKKIPVYRPK